MGVGQPPWRFLSRRDGGGPGSLRTSRKRRSRLVAEVAAFWSYHCHPARRSRVGEVEQPAMREAAPTFAEGANETHRKCDLSSALSIAVAFGDGPMTATGPESLRFSTTRLVRITSWCRSAVSFNSGPSTNGVLRRNFASHAGGSIGYSLKSRTASYVSSSFRSRCG